MALAKVVGHQDLATVEPNDAGVAAVAVQILGSQGQDAGPGPRFGPGPGTGGRTGTTARSPARCGSSSLLRGLPAAWPGRSGSCWRAWSTAAGIARWLRVGSVPGTPGTGNSGRVQEEESSLLRVRPRSKPRFGACRHRPDPSAGLEAHRPLRAPMMATWGKMKQKSHGITRK